MQMDPAAAQEKAVRELFDRLDELNVREYVVCAGARNASLVQVVTARSDALPEFRVTRFFDERSAAFFALGRTMSAGRPVAVFTTSGTAVAELLPAMVEAHYQRLPLIAVTADRPAEYAGSGAPQAIEQEGIFGVYANQLPGGPIHLNVRLEEKTLDDAALRRCVAATSMRNDTAAPMPVASGEEEAAWPEFWQDASPLVVLASGLTPQEAEGLRPVLARLRAPIVAEATANLHDFSELAGCLIRGGETALKRLNAGRVLRIGAVPSWRWWRDLEGCSEVKVLNVSHSGFRGLARTQQVRSVSLGSFLQSFDKLVSVNVPASTCESSKVLDELLQRFPNSEAAWMRHLARHIGSRAEVFLGNSLPIREWNLAVESMADGVIIRANRGANGIDGLISTWLGTGADADESWLILGDLSALYDANALWVLPQLKTAKRRLVVINNGGGQIFSRVGWLTSLPDTAREVMVNPHQLNFSAWAAMWGVGYLKCDDSLQLESLQDAGRGLEIWEIRPDAEQTAAFCRAWT